MHVATTKTIIEAAEANKHTAKLEFKFSISSFPFESSLISLHFSPIKNDKIMVYAVKMNAAIKGTILMPICSNISSCLYISNELTAAITQSRNEMIRGKVLSLANSQSV